MTIAFDGVFELGVPEMDRDHHCLVGMVNSPWPVSMGEVLSRLETVARESRAHFLREERLMDLSSFPQSSAHKGEHRALEAEIGKKITNLKCDRKIDVDAVASYTLDWLVEHIVTSDKDLALFLRGISAGSEKHRRGSLECDGSHPRI